MRRRACACNRLYSRPRRLTCSGSIAKLGVDAEAARHIPPNDVCPPWPSGPCRRRSHRSRGHRDHRPQVDRAGEGRSACPGDRSREGRGRRARRAGAPPRPSLTPPPAVQSHRPPSRGGAMDLFAEIDALRERWNVLRHPFYTRWERGDLSRDELAFYAGEYRHAVTALADAAAVAGDDGHAQEERDHIALWDGFAAALDAPLDRAPTPETSTCADAWAATDRLEALAVLYAVESAQPAISETKLRGLVDHYGFTAEGPATAYFALHAKRDVEHAREAREQLAAAAAPEDAERLVAAAESALRGNWTLLDGVERAA